MPICAAARYPKRLRLNLMKATMTDRSQAASEGFNILQPSVHGPCRRVLSGRGSACSCMSFGGSSQAMAGQSVKAIVALYPIFGSRPEGEPTLVWQAIAIAAMLPLDITLMVLGWLFSKISNGFEKLS